LITLPTAIVCPVALVSLAVVLIFAKRLDDLSRIVNFGALTAFLLLHLSVINHYLFRHHSRDWAKHLLFPLLGFTVIAYVLVEMDKAAKLMGAGWLALGIVYYVILCRVLKKPVVLKIQGATARR
jgi:amino acid transporter